MKRVIVTAPLLLLLAASPLAADTAAGTASFTVKTVATAEKYKPFNVMALWVTDAEGKFVRTLAMHAAKRQPYLKVWLKSSKKNIADAVTGATLKAHAAYTVKWDCRDADGKPVPDGDYEIRVEFSNANKEGPVTPAGHIKFTKGAKAVTIEPENLPHFTDMKLEFTPAK